MLLFNIFFEFDLFNSQTVSAALAGWQRRSAGGSSQEAHGAVKGCSGGTGEESLVYKVVTRLVEKLGF